VSYKKQLEKMGATPGKLAIVGVLTLVLVMVIAKQFPESTPGNTELSRAVVSQAKAEKASTNNLTTNNLTAKKLSPESKFPVWPDMNLAETLASDPFATPSWAIRKNPIVVATDNSREELLALQEQGASIVVIGKATKSATIGEQKIYIGDLLEGYRVTDITTNGIFLDKLTSQ